MNTIVTTEYTEMTVMGRDLQVGDFIDRTYRVEWRGPRGGKFYEPAYRVQSAVTAAQPFHTRSGIGAQAVTTLRHKRILVIDTQTVLIRRPHANI